MLLSFTNATAKLILNYPDILSQLKLFSIEVVVVDSSSKLCVSIEYP
jgi:hypothetical protein